MMLGFEETQDITFQLLDVILPANCVTNNKFKKICSNLKRFVPLLHCKRRIEF